MPNQTASISFMVPSAHRLSTKALYWSQRACPASVFANTAARLLSVRYPSRILSSGFSICIKRTTGSSEDQRSTFPAFSAARESVWLSK